VGLLLGAGCAANAACTDFTLVAVTAVPSVAPLPSLPPIGFNHRFGNSPVASADAFKLERSLFASKTYWEVALRTDPVLAGYVQLGDKARVRQARHRTTDLYLVMATEDRNTILGMLAFPTHADQAAYCEALLQAVIADGYDSLTKASVLVFFTESDQHAKLTWTPAGGYSYAVYDNDLRDTALRPPPSATPLPSPPV
jgi:hypothetical protein